MRLEIFAQLHTLSQFDMDSKPILPIVLAGQNNLVDKLMFHTSRPLASRIIGRSHLEGLKHKDMAGYIKHHLQVAGVKTNSSPTRPSSPSTRDREDSSAEPITSPRAPSWRQPPKNLQVVAAEHVRIASSELI